MGRIGRWLVWTALIAMIGGGAFLALQPQAIDVDWEEIDRGLLEVTIEEDGLTRVKDRYVVSSNVGGLLRRIELKPGDRIRQGETLLATIQPSDPSMLDARQVSQAKATVAAASAAVERAKARRDQAKVAADLAETQFGRANELWSSKTISREEYDAAVANHRSQQEALRVANFEQEIAQFEYQQAEAALQHFTASVDDDNTNLFEIRAPIDGLVLRTFQESATVVTPGLRLLEVGNPRDLELVIDVLSSDAVKVKPGDRVELWQWGGEQALQGVVRVVEPAAETKISTLGVEEQRVNVIADFNETPDVMSRLGDAYWGEARIVIWRDEDALKIPTSALFREQGEWFAFKIEDDKATKVRLVIGRRNATEAELLSGLQMGDSVVIYPSDMVTDGTRINRKSPSRLLTEDR